MKKITHFSKIILGAALLLFTMNSCKQEPKQEDPKEVAEEINDDKFANDEVEDDAGYLADAAEIHFCEIEIGKLALQKGTSTDVKKYAQTLITDHTKSLEELQALANKKTITLPTAISEDGQEKYDKLNKESGTEFDRKFIELVSEGHEKAVDKMTEIAQKATDPDIQLWTSRQTSTLTAHHEEAKKLKENFDK